jgi:hypothetical protein
MFLSELKDIFSEMLRRDLLYIVPESKNDEEYLIRKEATFLLRASFVTLSRWSISGPYKQCINNKGGLNNGN